MTDEPRTSPSGRPGVLVAVASRHGATREIAEAIARWLPQTEAGRAAGLSAVAVPVEQHPDPARYSAVVLGSAVYFGRWLEAAREYAATRAAVLRERPVWLFSSGPIGEPPFPPEEAHDAEPVAQLIGARGHAVFPGRLDRKGLGIGERAMVTAMRAPVGDFRDWDAVRAWTEQLAADLVLGVAVPAP